MIFLPFKTFVTTLNFFRPNVIKFGLMLGCRLMLQLHSIIYLFIYFLGVNFNKFTIELHFLLISFMFAIFQEDQRSITTSSIKCLIFEFL